MLQELTVLDAKRYGVFTCQGTTRLHEAARRMVDEDVSALVVVDGDGYLQGVLTHTDLLRAASIVSPWRDQLVETFMTRNVVTMPPEATLADVTQQLLEHCIHRVVVVRDEGGRARPVGVLASSDIIYHLVRDRN